MKMGSKWRKAKVALGLSVCAYVPGTHEGASPTVEAVAETFSDASDVSLSSGNSYFHPLTKTGSRSSKKTCAICLGNMKAGQGHALFTAECSHSFHFHCIASSVKHGNQVCPICRAKWKDIPFQGPSSSDVPGRIARVNPINWAQDDGVMTVLRRFPPLRTDSNRQISSLFHTSEPRVFNDDEPLDPQTENLEVKNSLAKGSQTNFPKTVEVKTYPEFSSVPCSTSHKNFTVLIHLKAPITSLRQISSEHHHASSSVSQTSRAPVDLVTVLDISGSMAGTKLALLKRAMGFVIQNLGPSDRLSVVSFSSTARRLFHLRRMSDSGRQLALQAVNSLISNGGTNIAEGLRKGAKVIEDRLMKNPVCSIILLSDGQDTYNVTSTGAGAGGDRPWLDYKSLLPSSVHGGSGYQIPVHTFGFGTDHDAPLMHSISETSGGTFSFIEAEGTIQDAFAQCIGGLLSIVVQKLSIRVECVQPTMSLGTIKAGSYASRMMNGGRMGFIDVGDLYADEERDFLVSFDIPAGPASKEIALVNVQCTYTDPVSKETLHLKSEEVKIQRLENVSEQPVPSIEVKRQKNRVKAAEAMAEARALAERGNLASAVAILETCRRGLSESMAGRVHDRLCVALDAEMKEMQERMANRQIYEATGRAYVLSGLSSHSWQRATARGDSTDSTSLVHAYQTPSMVNMVERSQTMVLTPPRPPVCPIRSSPALPQPR